MPISEAQARQAMPVFDFLINRLRASIAASVTTKMMICSAESETLMPWSLASNSQRAVSTGCRAISLLLCPRATKFCKKMDMPMAEISGTRRGLLRSGL